MNNKKLMRLNFRRTVFSKAGYRCQCCEAKGYDRQEPQTAVPGLVPLDAHHITDRNDFPNGGYVAKNGIAVCDTCHGKAEQYHATGEAAAGFAPADLYKIINSSFEEAYRADSKLT